MVILELLKCLALLLILLASSVVSEDERLVITGGSRVSPPHIQLLSAARHGDAAGIRHVAASNTVDVNARGPEGMAPIDLAVLSGNIESVTLLGSMGADLNALDNNKWTPLLSAAHHRRFDIVQALVVAGADPATSIRPINVAPPSREMATAGLLLVVSSMADYVNGVSYALHLIRGGADPNAATDRGWTAALYFASKASVAELQEAVERWGANPAVAETDGWTAFHFAAHRGDIRMVEALLDMGVDVGALTHTGLTAYAIAVGMNRKDIADFIQSSLSTQQEQRREGDQGQGTQEISQQDASAHVVTDSKDGASLATVVGAPGDDVSSKSHSEARSQAEAYHSPHRHAAFEQQKAQSRAEQEREAEAELLHATDQQENDDGGEGGKGILKDTIKKLFSFLPF